MGNLQEIPPIPASVVCKPEIPWIFWPSSSAVPASLEGRTILQLPHQDSDHACVVNWNG